LSANIESYFIAVGNTSVQVLPLAQKAIETYPLETNITVQALCDYVELKERGKYIRVSQFPGYDRKHLDILRRKIVRTAMGNFRHQQQVALAGYPVNNGLIFFAEVDCCHRARQIRGQVHGPLQVVRLPFDECWNQNCRCEYLPFRKNQSGSYSNIIRKQLDKAGIEIKT